MSLINLHGKNPAIRGGSLMKSHTNSNHDHDKQLITVFDALNDKPIVYHKIYSKIIGSTSAGLLLSQLIYWSKTMKHAQFYKTNTELCEELGMKIDEFKLAKKKIINKKLFFTFIKGVPATTYYQINLDLLVSLICKESNNIPSLQLVGKPPTGGWESHQLEGGKATNKKVGKPPTISENTQRITENNNNKEKVIDIAKIKRVNHDKCVVVLMEKLKLIEVSEVLVKRWLKKHGAEYVMEKVDYTISVERENPAGFLNNAITQDWKPSPEKGKRQANYKERPSEPVYPSHDENVAWYNSLTDEDKLKHLQAALFKYKIFEEHLKYHKTSVLDANFNGHSLFRVLMSLIGRAE